MTISTIEREIISVINGINVIDRSEKNDSGAKHCFNKIAANAENNQIKEITILNSDYVVYQDDNYSKYPYISDIFADQNQVVLIKKNNLNKNLLNNYLQQVIEHTLAIYFHHYFNHKK